MELVSNLRKTKWTFATFKLKIRLGISMCSLKLIRRFIIRFELRRSLNYLVGLIQMSKLSIRLDRVGVTTLLCIPSKAAYSTNGFIASSGMLGLGIKIKIL